MPCAPSTARRTCSVSAATRWWRSRSRQSIAASNALGVPLYRMLAGPDRPLLPLPMVNVISGGAHAAGGIDVQDLLVVPVGASSFSEAIEWAARVRTATASVAAESGLEARLVADEGGLGPAIASTEEALELLALGIARSGLRPCDDAAIAVDVAATQLALGRGMYALRNQGVELTATELVDLIDDWRRAYPIVSIEDPLARRRLERLDDRRHVSSTACSSSATTCS